MRLKHWLYTLLGVAVAAIAIYFAMNNQSSTIKTQLRDFAVEDTASVTKIFLADKADNTILLERQDDGTWKVNDTYLVRPDVINNLLGTINTITLRAPAFSYRTLTVYGRPFQATSPNQQYLSLTPGQVDPGR